MNLNVVFLSVLENKEIMPANFDILRNFVCKINDKQMVLKCTHFLKWFLFNTQYIKLTK